MEVSILCPAIRVRIQIGSKILDDFKMFSGFVLRALFEGYTLSDIDAVIGLGETVIVEEIDYLRKIGFIIDAETTCSVGGREFCNLMSAVDAVNQCEINAFIELFSGTILPYNPEIFTDTADDNSSATLAKNVYLSSFYERDYGQTKDFALIQSGELLGGINEKQSDSLYTQLEFNKESEGFIRLTLDEIPPIDRPFEQSQQSTLGLRHSLLQINWTAENPKLKKYESYFELLKMLSGVEDGLLVSQFGYELLEEQARVREYNREIKPLIYDNFLCRFIDSAPSGAGRTYDVELHQQIDVSQEQWQGACKDYFRYYIDTNILASTNLKNHLEIATITVDDNYYIQRIPFDLFLSNLFKQEKVGDI